MKVRVYLHGHLRDKIQKNFLDLEANTLMDVLKIVEQNYRKVLKAPLDLGRWKLRVKGFDTDESWKAPLTTNEIHIYPELKFGKSQKNSALVQIGIAAALVVVSVATMGTGTFAAASAAMAAGTATTGQAALVLATQAALSTGIALAASGVMTLLFPQPNLSTSSSTDSKYLGIQENTIAAGTRIPFGYGLYRVSGHYLSYNVSATKLVTVGGN